MSTVELTGYGILAPFSDERDVEVPLQENIATGAALNVLLDKYGFPAADRAIDAGWSPIGKWWITNESSWIDAIHALEDEELGSVREGADRLDKRHSPTPPWAIFRWTSRPQTSSTK